MKKEKIAIISDIHGNSWALNEILNDIKTRGIKGIINLGDSLYGPLDPYGTYQLLIENDVISISGNQDRFILEHLDIKTDMITLEYVKDQINGDVVDWLRELQFNYVYKNKVYCFHASPSNDSIYLLENLEPEFISIKDNQTLNIIIQNVKQQILVCGHSHVPGIVDTGIKTIINPGSVGLQAYDDDFPIPHKIENYTPHARYSILEFTDKLTSIDQIAISYDFEKPAKIAVKNKRNDWAKWLRTGRV